MNEQSSSFWRRGLWITRAAALLGVVAIGAGLMDLHLLLTPILRFVALLALGLAIVAIPMALWGAKRSSRRLRRPVFWGSILVDLALIGSLGVLCLKAYRLPQPAPPVRMSNDGDLPPE